MLSLAPEAVTQSTVEMILQWANLIILPLLAAFTRWLWLQGNQITLLLKRTEGLADIEKAVSWLQREHEAVDGKQEWKNPGLAEAINAQTGVLGELASDLKTTSALQTQTMHQLLESQKESSIHQREMTNALMRLGA